MIIDNGPAIRTFCEERIKQLTKAAENSSANDGRLDELEMIVTLCNGLEAQNKILSNMLAPHTQFREQNKPLET